MALHRLEVYVDSYRTKPFVRDFEDNIELSPNDERQLEDWIRNMTGRAVDIVRNLRIEDIKHHYFDTARDLVHATSVRVSIVE